MTPLVVPGYDRSVLVGRESERQTIATLLASARVGESRVLVLLGEPGIGKSTLLAEAESMVGDMHVLRAGGLESEQVVPFAGLLQVLRPILDRMPQIPAPQARALSSALLLGGPGAGPGPTEPSRFAVGAATLSLLARAAEDHPVAVLIDDAHWLDQPSAEALVFAARRLASDSIAMVAAVRAHDAGAQLWTALPVLELQGLALGAAGQLVGAVGEQELARLHHLTAGNPLALLELKDQVDELAALPAESAVPVSEQVSRAFLGQVERLGADTRTVLLVAAADSANVASVLAAAQQLGVPTPHLTEAEDAGLIEVRDDRVDFRHPLVRSAVYGAADAATRRAVHRALAAVVPRDETDRLAWHLARGASPPDEETALVLEGIARDAAARGAHAIAALAHERAAELGGDPNRAPARLAAAGEAAWLAGLTQRAVRLLDRALTAEPEPPLRGHVLEVRGAVQTRCGSLHDALVMYLAAARAEHADPDLAIRLSADAVHAAFYLLEPDAALQASSTIEGLLARCHDSWTRALGTAASGMAMVLFGSGAEGVKRLRSAVPRLVIRDEDLDVHQFRLPLLIQGSLWLRDAGPRRNVLNAAIERLRQRAALGSLPYLLMHVARDGAASDRWQDADAAYVESIRLARETGQTTDLAVSLSGSAILAARRGSADECRAHVREAEALSRRSDIGLALVWLTAAQGDLAAGFGDVAAAAQCYERLGRFLRERRLADPDPSCAPELVEVYVHQSRLDEARDLAQEFSGQAAAKGHSWALARAERALAVAAGSDAEDHFRAALELHERTPDRYERARTELALGAWLRRERRRIEARPVLASAVASFDELGAHPWADRAARELQATGATAHRNPSAAAKLTPQERQIAQLLASGRTTREAAEALFLSSKTVEYHLRHVYQKLGIRSRAELAEALTPRS